MNETYQHPGKWHDFILVPNLVRYDETHYLMSHIIKGLEHNSVYEAMVQAKNMYGWNEVRLCGYFDRYLVVGLQLFLLSLFLSLMMTMMAMMMEVIHYNLVA
jgi:hypothetical protein